MADTVAKDSDDALFRCRVQLKGQGIGITADRIACPIQSQDAPVKGLIAHAGLLVVLLGILRCVTVDAMNRRRRTIRIFRQIVEDFYFILGCPRYGYPVVDRIEQGLSRSLVEKGQGRRLFRKRLENIDMRFFDIRKFTDRTALQIEAADAPVKDLSQEGIGQIQFQSRRISLLVIHERLVRRTDLSVIAFFFLFLQDLHVIHDSPVDTAPAQDGMAISRIRRRIMEGDMRFFPQSRHVITIGLYMLPRFFQGRIDTVGVRRLTSAGKDADPQGQGHESRDKS